MRCKLSLLSAALLALALSSCRSYAGTVRLEKNADGKWEATEVVIPDEDITPGELKELEDALNER